MFDPAKSAVLLAMLNDPLSQGFTYSRKFF